MVASTCLSYTVGFSGDVQKSISSKYSMYLSAIESTNNTERDRWYLWGAWWGRTKVKLHTDHWRSSGKQRVTYLINVWELMPDRYKKIKNENKMANKNKKNASWSSESL